MLVPDDCFCIDDPKHVDSLISTYYAKTFVTEGTLINFVFLYRNGK